VKSQLVPYENLFRSRGCWSKVSSPAYQINQINSCQGLSRIVSHEWRINRLSSPFNVGGFPALQSWLHCQGDLMTPLMPSNLIRSTSQAVCAGLTEGVIALGSILIVLGFLAGLPRSDFGTAVVPGSQGHLLSEYSDRRKWLKICLNISFESLLLCLPIRLSTVNS